MLQIGTLKTGTYKSGDELQTMHIYLNHTKPPTNYFGSKNFYQVKITITEDGQKTKKMETAKFTRNDSSVIKVTEELTRVMGADKLVFENQVKAFIQEHWNTLE